MTAAAIVICRSNLDTALKGKHVRLVRVDQINFFWSKLSAIAIGKKTWSIIHCYVLRQTYITVDINVWKDCWKMIKWPLLLFTFNILALQQPLHYFIENFALDVFEVPSFRTRMVIVIYYLSEFNHDDISLSFLSIWKLQGFRVLING